MGKSLILLRLDRIPERLFGMPVDSNFAVNNPLAATRAWFA